MNAVGISGGVAGNVVPDEARVSVNYRFAPDLDEKQALAHVQELFDGFEVVVTDTAPARCPASTIRRQQRSWRPSASTVKPKYGWTDVAQFTQLGIPAVNFGPGDPTYAHKADEHVPVDHLIRVEEAMTAWLTT